MRGPRRLAWSASRPAPSFTTAAANSAAPSSAPKACGPPPSTPVTNAGSSSDIISLAKSFSSETQPNSWTWRGRARPLGGIEAETPADQGDRQTPVAEQCVVEVAQRGPGPPCRPQLVTQLEDLTAPDGVAQRLRRLGAIAPYLRLRVGAIHVQLADELVHRLLERHAPGVQADVEQHARRAPQQMHALEERLFFRLVEPLLAHHLFAVQRPPLHSERRPHVLARVRPLGLRVHQMEGMARISFVQRRGRQLGAAAERPCGGGTREGGPAVL